MTAKKHLINLLLSFTAFLDFPFGGHKRVRKVSIFSIVRRNFGQGFSHIQTGLSQELFISLYIFYCFLMYLIFVLFSIIVGSLIQSLLMLNSNGIRVSILLLKKQKQTYTPFTLINKVRLIADNIQGLPYNELFPVMRSV